MSHDAAPHLPYALLAAALERLPPAPADEGSVVLVVARPESGARITPGRCLLTPGEGVAGDRWAKAEKPLLAAQVSAMRADVARVVANGQPLSLFGDNLLVDLDLSADNLPEGTRLRVGTAVCRVTGKPHTGCVKFAARFGQDARDVVGAEAFRAGRPRGLFLRVEEAGEVGPGDRIAVLERGPGAASS